MRDKTICPCHPRFSGKSNTAEVQFCIELATQIGTFLVFLMPLPVAVLLAGPNLLRSVGPVSPLIWFPAVGIGLGFILTRRIRFLELWTSRPTVWTGRVALILGGGFALFTLAGDVADIL